MAGSPSQQPPHMMWQMTSGQPDVRMSRPQSAQPDLITSNMQVLCVKLFIIILNMPATTKNQYFYHKILFLHRIFTMLHFIH